MYSVSFRASTSDDLYDSATEVNINFPEQPSWARLADKFLEFLKSQGYVFDIHDKLDVVTAINDKEDDYFEDTSPWDDDPMTEEEEEEDKPRKRSGKGKKKK